MIAMIAADLAPLYGLTARQSDLQYSCCRRASQAITAPQPSPTARPGPAS